MIELKNKKLENDLPVCKLKRVSLDLGNFKDREKVFEDLGKISKNVLIITEGVIPYLSNDEAASLADDLGEIENFKYWIQDFHQGNIRRRVPRSWAKKLKSAPFKFHTKNWFEFFKNHGWVPHKQISVVEEAERLKRPFPFIFPWSLIMWLLQAHKREKFRAMNGYVTMKKTTLEEK